MKSERRHELATNELADWLAHVVQTTKTYQNVILFVLIAAVAVLGGYAWWSWQRAAQLETGWEKFYGTFSTQGMIPVGFDEIAEEYSGTYLGNLASAVAGDLHLNAGCNLLFVNKANANEQLDQAVDQYGIVLKASNRPMLIQRVTFGLARTNEAQGNLDQAIEFYEEVQSRWPDGAYAGQAARRAEELKRPAVKAWYDRFAKFDPMPAFSDEPGVPGQHVPFDLEKGLPEEGSLFESSIDLGPTGSDLQEPSAEPPVTSPKLPTKVEPPAESTDAEKATEPTPDTSAEPAK